MFAAIHFEPGLFEENLVTILFFYGLAFFSMGLVILARTRASRLEISTALPWLAAFGIIHGVTEWLDMFAEIYSALESNFYYALLGFTLFLISVICILIFGVLLIVKLTKDQRYWFIPVILASIWLFIVVPFTFTHTFEEWIAHSLNMTRYFFYFTGSVISGIAMIYQFIKFKQQQLTHIGRNFIRAAIAFFLNGIFAGLIARQTIFFPANIINTVNFSQIFGFPVQLIRGLLAITIAFFVVRGLEVFNYEEEQKIKTLRDKERTATDEAERLAKQYSILYQKQKNISGVLQKSLQPVKTPVLEEYSMGIHYRSATAEAAIGGDFYDYVLSPDDTLHIVLGDVSGKGIKAATETAKIKNLLQYFLQAGQKPNEAMANLNNALFEQYKASKFFTLVILSYKKDDISFTVTNAGHPPPIILNQSSNEISHTTSISGIALAVTKNAVYRSGKIRKKGSDYIVLYTDGLSEARYNSHLYGEERIGKNLKKLKDYSAQEIADNLVNNAYHFAKNVLLDDVLVLVLKKI